MIARAGSGWQTVLADLSLILFMVTAASVSEAPDPAEAPRAEPVAVWRPGGQRLDEWHAGQGSDPRLRLTVTLRSEPGRETEALEAALAELGGAQGARIVLDPDPGPPLEAVLTYDRSVEP